MILSLVTSWIRIQELVSISEFNEQKFIEELNSFETILERYKYSNEKKSMTFYMKKLVSDGYDIRNKNMVDYIDYSENPVDDILEDINIALWNIRQNIGGAL